FLMDEPLSNLDANLRVQMRSELKLLNSKIGVTTLYVTHDQIEAMTMGDRVAVLSPVSGPDECNLQQCASPAEIYDNPANLFVAGFIGSPAMNFIRGRIDMSEEGPELRIPQAASSLDFHPSLAAARPELAKWQDREVILGIRPEFFSLATDGGSTLTAEALMVEMTGADAYLHFELPVAPAAIASTIVDETIPQRGQHVVARIQPRKYLPRRGERVSLAVALEHVHFFDPDSGNAIH